MVISKTSLAYRLSFTLCKIGKSTIHNQGIIWEDQVRGWIPLCLLEPKVKKEKFAITDITNQDLRKFLNKFKDSPYLGYKQKQVQN